MNSSRRSKQQQEHNRRQLASEKYRQRLRSQNQARVLRNRKITSRTTLSLESVLLQSKVAKKRVRLSSTMSSVSTDSAYTSVQQCVLEDPELPTAQRLEKQETIEPATPNGIVLPKIEALLQVIPSEPSRICELHIDFADYTAITKSSLSILHCSVMTRFPSPINPRLHPALHVQYIAGTECMGYPESVINFVLSVSQPSLSPDLKEMHRNFEQYLKTKFSSKITNLIRVVPHCNRPEKVGNITKSSCKLSKQNISAKILENASLLVEKTTLRKRPPCLISVENNVKKIKIGQKICKVVQTKKYAPQFIINFPLSSPLEIDYSILPVFKLRSIESVKASSSSTSESLGLIAGESKANHFQTFNPNTSPLLSYIPVFIPKLVGFEETIFEPYIPTSQKSSTLPQTQFPSDEQPMIVEKPFMQAMQKVSSVVDPNIVPKMPSASPKYKQFKLERAQSARTKAILPKLMSKKTLSDLKSSKSKSPCSNSTLFKNRDTNSSNLSSVLFENIVEQAPKWQTISSQMSRTLVIDQTLIPSIETSNSNRFPFQIPTNPKYSNTSKSYTREERTFCFDDVELLNLKDEIGRTYNLGHEKISSDDLYIFSDEEFLETNVQMSDILP